MAKELLENKQLVHIASEVVALVGLAFYFSSKNKQLLTHIEELSQRMEDQEDALQRVETTLQKVTQRLDALAQQTGQNLNMLTSGLNQLMETRKKKTNLNSKVEVGTLSLQSISPLAVHVTSPIIESNERSGEKSGERRVSFSNPEATSKTIPSVEEIEEDDEELSDSDLDVEIQAELDELVEDEISLKKQA